LGLDKACSTPREPVTVESPPETGPDELRRIFTGLTTRWLASTDPPAQRRCRRRGRTTSLSGSQSSCGSSEATSSTSLCPTRGQTAGGSRAVAPAHTVLAVDLALRVLLPGDVHDSGAGKQPEDSSKPGGSAQRVARDVPHQARPPATARRRSTITPPASRPLMKKRAKEMARKASC